MQYWEGSLTRSEASIKLSSFLWITALNSPTFTVSEREKTRVRVYRLVCTYLSIILLFALPSIKQFSYCCKMFVAKTSSSFPIQLTFVCWRSLQQFIIFGWPKCHILSRAEAVTGESKGSHKALWQWRTRKGTKPRKNPAINSHSSRKWGILECKCEVLNKNHLVYCILPYLVLWLHKKQPSAAWKELPLYILACNSQKWL